jgi:GT2 family glycosyltransferase
VHHNKIAIIVLNWNGKKDTLECLESIRQIDYQNFDIIVVDNGSNDDSVRAIQNKFSEVKVLETGENLGYAGGNNFGTRYAIKHGADYILLLNNDVIVDPQLIKNFIDAVLKVGPWAIFSAKIFYFSQPKKIWYAGARRIKSTAHFIHIGQGSIDNGNEFNSLTETDYACGCAIFFYKGVIDKVGLFDEKFYLTYEEADFCYRAKKAGIKSYIVPGAKIWHKVSVSFGGEESALFRYFMNRNKLLWAEKNLPFFQRVLVYIRASNEFLSLLLPPFRLKMANDISFIKKISSSLVEYRYSVIKYYNDPLRKAKILGLRDFLLRRFGGCSESVKSIRT